MGRDLACIHLTESTVVSQTLVRFIRHDLMGDAREKELTILDISDTSFDL